MNSEDKIIAKLEEMDTKLVAVDKVVIKVDALDKTLSRTVTKLDEMDKTLNRTVAKLDEMDKTQNKVVAKLVEMDAYLREKVATKDELRTVKNELVNHIDGFAKKHESFDHELVAMRVRVNRIEGKPALP